jgi:hypothetical protein
MSKSYIESREDLKNYILRRLGDPVLKINVSDDQVDDRIDDTLTKFSEFHTDATVTLFQKYVITATDVEKQWVPIPPNVFSIRRIIPLIDSSGGGSSGMPMFDPKFQYLQSDLLSFGSKDLTLTNMTILQGYTRQLQMDTSGLTEMTQFARHLDRLYIYVDWGTDLVAGSVIIIESTRIITEDDSGAIFNNSWVRDYATALVKYQWGSNMSKYQGISMVGGVTFNGDLIMNEAKEEILRLSDELRQTWEVPPTFMMG